LTKCGVRILVYKKKKALALRMENSRDDSVSSTILGQRKIPNATHHPGFGTGRHNRVALSTPQKD
jgi:hypothetical protein